MIRGILGLRPFLMIMNKSVSYFREKEVSYTAFGAVFNVTHRWRSLSTFTGDISRQSQ